MQDIKFRAYDTRLKKWCYDGEGFSLFGEVMLIDGFSSHFQENPIEGLGILDRIYTDIEVMRFTGKIDKNKTEIYEGDILRLHDSHEFSKKNPYNFGIVCFGDGNYDTGFYEFVGFYLKIPNVYFDGDGYQWPEDKPFEEDGSAGWLFDTDGIEVIDNIYENKLKLL